MSAIPTSPVRIQSPNFNGLQANDPAVSQSTKPDVEKVKSGTSEVKGALEDTYQNADTNSGEIKDKGKKTGSKLVDVKNDLKGAASAAGEAVDATLTGAENIAAGAADNAPRAQQGAEEAATGLFNKIKKPFIWTSNKVSALGTNLTTPRTGERFSPALGAALALGGTALFTAAAAASWSATLFINLPTLALGTALLGATMLAATYLGRAFKSPVAPSTGEAKLAGTEAHRTGVETETRREQGYKIVKDKQAEVTEEINQYEAEKKALIQKMEKAHTTYSTLTQELAIIDSYTRAPEEATLIAEAKILNEDSFLKVKPAVTGKRKTTEKTVQGDQSAGNPENKTENAKIDFEAVPATAS